MKNQLQCFRLIDKLTMKLIFLLTLTALVIKVNAQTSTQNFGTGTGSFTSQSGVTTFLPNPTSGTTWTRAGATAPAAPVVLANSSNPLATANSFVRAVASSSTSVCKFSPMVGYAGSTEFYTSFKALFGDAAAGATANAGSWTFYQGAGAMYGDASDFTGTQVFTGLRFTYGASGVLTLTYRNGAAFNSTGLTTSSFSQGVVYTIEIVGNNKTSGSISYTYNGVSQTVAVQKFDLFINGTRIGDDLAEAQLPANTNIASNCFNGISSTGNVANVFVDDVITYNVVPATIGSAPVAPTVISPTAASITLTTATLGGNITADGGSPVTDYGIVWSSTNNDPLIGGLNVTQVNISGAGSGVFTTGVTGLPAGTLIYFKAYATSANGTGYSTVSSFSTIKPEPSSHPTLFGCGVTSQTSIPLSWTDATGTYTPNGYLIKWSSVSFAAIADPDDLTPEANGPSTLNVAQGVQSATISGLTNTTTYYFKIFAYSNSGSNIDYKIVSAPQTSCATLAPPILAWQFGSPASLGDEVSYASTTNNVNLNSSVLTRGSGITPVALARALSSSNFTVAGDKTNAINSNQYFQFTAKANAGNFLSLSILDARLRRSSAGPNAYVWRYSVDGINFTDVPSGDVSFTSTVDGVDQAQINLSGITALQNLSSTVTVTFRLYAWGATNLGGTFAIGRFGSGNTSNSLALGGTLTPCTAISAPVFALGISSSRCQGAETVAYPATSSNSTGITYDLDATTLAFAGNSFNSSTGEISYAAGWIGTSIITATATGCDGPLSAIHTVTTNATPTATLGGSAVICQNETSTLSISFTGSANWSYTISDGGFSQTGSSSSATATITIPANSLSAGVHTFSITTFSDAHCTGTVSGSGTITVSSNTALTGKYISSITQFDNSALPVATCNDASIVYHIKANGIAPFSGLQYQWSKGTNSGNMEFSADGLSGWAGTLTVSGSDVYVRFLSIAAGYSGYRMCVQAKTNCQNTLNFCPWIQGALNTPGPITGGATTLCTPTTEAYTCGASTGATQYRWSFPGSGAPDVITAVPNAVLSIPTFVSTQQLCVKAELSCGAGTAGTARCVTLTHQVAAVGPMAGPSPACPGASNVPYSVAALAGAETYNWSVPSGVSIVETPPYSNVVTLNFPSNYTGAPNVCVTVANSCSTPQTRCKTVVSGTPATPGTIGGPLTNICNSTIGYTISNVSGATSYLWSLPTGVTINSGSSNGNTSILVDVSPSFAGGNLTVVANNAGCTPMAVSAPRTVPISGKPSTPSIITANPVSWCNSNFVNFSVALNSPPTTYNWAVSNSGSSIDAGQGSNSIDVVWGTVNAGTVYLTASNGCGTSSTRSQTFTSTGNCREGLFDTHIESKFNAYPNPAYDHLTIEFTTTATENCKITVSDLSGRVISSRKVEATKGNNTINMDCTQIAKGVYMLEVKSDSVSDRTRVIIE